ncbi:MAG: GNAT family N-acetyltransferase [Lachnospiraceae bacterium]|nr:GNAT family N-acetyltransferase [Lachnospiraceae bacterium]
MRYLKRVIYDDGLITAEDFDELLKALRSAGVEVNRVSDGAVAVPSDTLFICMDKSTCDTARRSGIAFITYRMDEKDSQCIVEGFEEITADFCEKMLMRQTGRPWIIAQTDRLIIRELCADDELGMFSDRWGDREYIKRYADCQYRLFGYGIWAVIKRDEDVIIGKAGLFNSELHDGLELGYEIAAGYRRQGFAYEACSAICGYAERVLEAGRIFVTVSSLNTASVRLAGKLKKAENIDIVISLDYTDDRK